jgi:hypothetical protein
VKQSVKLICTGFSVQPLDEGQALLTISSTCTMSLLSELLNGPYQQEVLKVMKELEQEIEFEKESEALINGGL